MSLCCWEVTRRAHRDEVPRSDALRVNGKRVHPEDELDVVHEARHGAADLMRRARRLDAHEDVRVGHLLTLVVHELVRAPVVLLHDLDAAARDLRNHRHAVLLLTLGVRTAKRCLRLRRELDGDDPVLEQADQRLTRKDGPLAQEVRLEDRLQRDDLPVARQLQLAAEHATGEDARTGLCRALRVERLADPLRMRLVYEDAVVVGDPKAGERALARHPGVCMCVRVAINEDLWETPARTQTHTHANKRDKVC